MNKYIGKDVQLIYMDRKHEVSIRNIKVLVTGEKRFVAYCYTAQSIHTFNIVGVIDMEVITYGKEA